jgi:hypothetical protein
VRSASSLAPAGGRTPGTDRKVRPAKHNSMCCLGRPGGRGRGHGGQGELLNSEVNAEPMPAAFRAGRVDVFVPQAHSKSTLILAQNL